MHFDGWVDGSLLEAASWRLASELARRHPVTTWLYRAHPGGGQSDCLWLRPTVGTQGDVRLNRNGTIQVVERFDGRPARRKPTDWETYFRSDPRSFLMGLEADAGLPALPQVPPSTPRTLTLRLLAALVSTAVKTVDPMEVVPGFIDSSDDSHPYREGFDCFPSIPPELLRVRADDLFGQPGYRFWFLRRSGQPILAFEQTSGTSWARGSDVSIDVMRLYALSGRRVLPVVLELLRSTST